MATVKTRRVSRIHRAAIQADAILGGEGDAVGFRVDCPCARLIWSTDLGYAVRQAGGRTVVTGNENATVNGYQCTYL
jgi:hypothetical protein